MTAHEEYIRALDFQFPAWWSDEQRQAHRDRVAKLEDEALAEGRAFIAKREAEREERFWREIEEEAQKHEPVVSSITVDEEGDIVDFEY